MSEIRDEDLQYAHPPRLIDDADPLPEPKNPDDDGGDDSG